MTETMRCNLLYLSLAMVGATMIIIGVYTQWVSTDLTRFSLIEYFLMDIRLWNWWTAVGVPILVGTIYFATAVLGLIHAVNDSHIFWQLLAAFGLAILTLPIGGLANFAAVATALLVLLAWFRRGKRANGAT